MPSISIHAPSRERRCCLWPCYEFPKHFNPRSLAGATLSVIIFLLLFIDFNPRSLAGATSQHARRYPHVAISIHAPSRERRMVALLLVQLGNISIHAPSRERRTLRCSCHGSEDFNPRSLTGATANYFQCRKFRGISIHAPSRERLGTAQNFFVAPAFQSTLPHGSDFLFLAYRLTFFYFNPRSLTGATLALKILKLIPLFQSTLPHGSDP